MNALVKASLKKLKNIRELYIRANYPLLPITKFFRLPLKWFYHQSPYLRHDNRFYWKPFFLSQFHQLLNAGYHPPDFKIYGDALLFRSFGSIMSYQAYYVGEVESHLMLNMISHLKPGFVMLDIGAHHGAHTIIAAYELQKRGWDGVIHSFEPDPRNFEILEHNVKQNNLSGYVKLYNNAVGEFRDTLDFVMGNDNSCNFLKHTSSEDVLQSDLLKDALVQKVETLRIDDLGIENISLIKIDIQGAEAYALRGSQESITKYEPTILVEAVTEYAYANEVMSVLNDLGYVAKGVDKFGKLCPAGSPEHFVSWDYVAMPKSFLADSNQRKYSNPSWDGNRVQGCNPCVGATPPLPPFHK
jgi:FkbM family methyltransferase